MHPKSSALVCIMHRNCLLLISFACSSSHPTPVGAEDLLERAKNLKLPKNPLDDLVERLGGPDAVAEMTGRQKRMELQPCGGYSYVSRAAHYGNCSLDDVSASPVLLHRVTGSLPT